jgi:hypothetical protein
VNSLWTLGTLVEFSISTSRLCQIQYRWFHCVRALSRYRIARFGR